MTEHSAVRLRVAACPADSGNSSKWDFYVLNDGEATVTRLVLETMEWEWGDQSRLAHPQSEVINLAPQGLAFLWSDDDNEVRVLLHLRVWLGDLQKQALVRFPMLYKRRGELSEVGGLHRQGWVEPAAIVSE